MADMMAALMVEKMDFCLVGELAFYRVAFIVDRMGFYLGPK
jgi:hypothetical protein